MSIDSFLIYQRGLTPNQPMFGGYQPYMEVSWNGGTPNSSSLDWDFPWKIIQPLGSPHWWNPPYIFEVLGMDQNQKTTFRGNRRLGEELRQFRSIENVGLESKLPRINGMFHDFTMNEWHLVFKKWEKVTNYVFFFIQSWPTKPEINWSCFFLNTIE